MDAKVNDRKAVTSLVLGIVAIVVPVIGVLTAILAIIFGASSIKKINSDPNLQGKGLAIAGIVCACVGLITQLFVIIALVAYFGVLSPSKMANVSVNKCLIALPLMCIGSPVKDGDIVRISVRNQVGDTISIDPTNIKSDTGACSEYTLSNNVLSDSETFTIGMKCTSMNQYIKDSFTITYHDSVTGLNVPVPGSILVYSR